MNKRMERAQRIAEKQSFDEKKHRLLSVLVQKLMVSGMSCV